MPTGNEFLDPDASRAYLHDWQARIERNAENARVLSERLTTLRGTARDAGNLTEVTVDSAGALVDIRFETRSRGAAPETLAHAVLEATRIARRQVTEHSQRLVTDTLGTDSIAARAINRQLGGDHG